MIRAVGALWTEDFCLIFQIVLYVLKGLSTGKFSTPSCTQQPITQGLKGCGVSIAGDLPDWRLLQKLAKPIKKQSDNSQPYSQKGLIRAVSGSDSDGKDFYG